MSTSFMLSLFALAFAVVFKPLLTGVVKAVLLALRRPLTREEREARAHLRTARVLQGMFSSELDPSSAAELRSLAARG